MTSCSLIKGKGQQHRTEAPCGEVAWMRPCDSVAPHFVCCLVMARAVHATAVLTLSAAGCRAENWERSDRISVLLQSCCFFSLALLFPLLHTELQVCSDTCGVLREGGLHLGFEFRRMQIDALHAVGGM